MRTPLLSAIGLLASLAVAQPRVAQAPAIQAPSLLTPHHGAVDPEPAHFYRRSRTVRVNLELLRRARIGHLIQIPMFTDLVYTVRLTRLEVEPHVKDTFHWHGEIVGRENTTVILTVHKDGFAGWIFPDDPAIQSLSIQGAPGTYCARELNDAAHQGSVVQAPHAHRVLGSSACNDDKNRIELLLVYDRTAVVAAGGTSRVVAAISNGVAAANNACSRSSMTMRYITKRIQAISYTSSGNQGTDLSRLRLTTDRIMDEVHTWRRTYSADLVGLVRGGGGGVAYCYGGYTLGFSVNGYSSLGSQVLAHEFGHNLGAGHDPNNNPRNNGCFNTTYGRGHNWLVQERGFPFYTRSYDYTVMSYSVNWGSCSFPWSCTKRRLPQYSSPLVSVRYTGTNIVKKTGTTTRDNRRTLLEFAQRVANYSITVTGRNRAPVVTRHPSSRTLCSGYLAANTTVMSVAVNGYGNSVRYQWRKNGRSISGKTRSTLTLSTNITATDAGSYDCVMTTCAGTVISRRATLRVGPCRVLRVGLNDDQNVANLGDLDGDGYNDFGIARPTYPGTSSQFIAYSGRTHKTFTAWQLAGGERTGTSMAYGDIDGDGKMDAILGSPGYSANRGRIIVQPGKWITRRTFWNFKVGTAAGQQIGTHVGAGRFDRYANTDVVSAYGDRVTAWSSRSGWPQLWSVQPQRGLAITAMVVVGDVNSDGYDDIGIGVASYRNNSGLVSILSGRNGAALRTLAYNAPNMRAGQALAAPGDVNGDQVPDLCFGAPGWGTNRGWVSMRNGANIFSQLSQSLGTVVGQRRGWVLSSGGDINRDGRNDVVVTEVPTSSTKSGVVRVLSGGNLATQYWARSGSSTHGRSTALFDSNGDCIADVMVSEYGKQVYLWDAAPKSSPPKFEIYGRAGPGTGGAIPRINTGLPLARIAGRQIVRLHGARARSAAICRLAISRANVPLDAVGITHGSLLVQNSIVDWVLPTSSTGRAQFTLPISTNTRYTGLKLTWQWIVLDRGGNRFGLTLSDAAEMRIGAR